MLVRSRLRLRRRGGGAASGGGGGGISNTVLPSFIQPDGGGGWEPADPVDTNPDVFLDAGTWTGGTPPYSYEYAIYYASDDSVIVARTATPEVDMGTLTGLTIYGRVWCIDALANETSADTADFGPIASGFTPTVLAALNFRSTDPTGIPADEPVAPATFALGTDTYTGSVIRGGFIFGRTSGSSAGDRTASSDPRLRGFNSFSASTAEFRVDMPGGYTGNVTIKLASGTTNSATTSNIIVYDGPAVAGNEIIILDAAYASGEVVDATNVAMALASWSAAGGNPVSHTLVNNYMTIRRRASSPSAGHICHLYVESAP